ncbi:MAG TPA: hypothetical protein VK473_16435 [Terriglobales bacterium]|nr:hypothetical protein [Terriglobales bacterium]
MRKILVISVLLLMLALTAPLWAQGTNDVYQVSPWEKFSVEAGGLNAAEADFAFVEIVNPGEQGTPLSAHHGTVCADIYWFDKNQEMLECCSCSLTANALLRLQIGRELNQNPLTGFPAPQHGVVKIVSDNQANCDPTSPVPTPDLRAWTSSLFASSAPVQVEPPGTFVGRSRDLFAQVPLQADELAFLGQACAFVQFLGSGKGVCSCGDHS